MQFKPRWRIVPVSPPILIVALYCFLLSANYYYASRAAYLLERIRVLKADDSSIEELKRIGAEPGFRYTVPSHLPCANSLPCAYIVSPNNGWMRSLLLPLAQTNLGRHTGLKAWEVWGFILADGEGRTSKGYVLVILTGSYFPETQVSVSEQHHSEYNSCIYRPLKRHPGYEIHRASNFRSLRAIVSDGASEENRRRAFHFSLDCLTSRSPCDQLSEIIPSVWIDYESDLAWVEQHPGEHDPQCE